MQDEAAHMMSPSNVTQPFNARRILKHSLPINMRSTASVNALPSVSPFLRPRVGPLIASCKTCFSRNSKYWLLDFPVTCCQWEEGADNTSDMTQLESCTYWSLQSEFYPKEDFFTLWLYCFISTYFYSLDSLPLLLKSKWQETTNCWQKYLF